MERYLEYEVILWEDEIERDVTGKITHHPLNSRYSIKHGEDTVSYGHLTFAGHDLDKSSILEDVKVFYLEFRGEPKEVYDREEWADTFRTEVLNRLTKENQCWYMSMIDIWSRAIGDTITRIVETRLNQIEVESEKPHGYSYGFIRRQFVEIPNRFLSEVSRYFWSEASPGFPIEGYNMETGQIEVLKKWDKRPRDEKLFREVIDRTLINFYTFPAEHRDFVFVTNKLNYAELANLIGLEELQERARKMG